MSIFPAAWPNKIYVRLDDLEFKLPFIIKDEFDRTTSVKKSNIQKDIFGNYVIEEVREDVMTLKLEGVCTYKEYKNLIEKYYRDFMSTLTLEIINYESYKVIFNSSIKDVIKFEPLNHYLNMSDDEPGKININFIVIERL